MTTEKRDAMRYTERQMNENNIDRTAFLIGYLDGQKTRKHISIAQAEREYQGLSVQSIECYLNGRDDACRGDDWRYKQVLALVNSST